MPDRQLIIGTRGSDLALWQARTVKQALEAAGGFRVEITEIKTQGDRIDHLSFDKMEGKGFFTKELEDALLDRTCDLAVHSLKDLPTTQPDGLKLGAVGFRSDRRELLLIRKESRAGDGLLPVEPGGIIGTSSARRKAQIAAHNPELKIRDLRGNVPTRIRKLREGQYNAIVIAAAGAERLALDLSDLDAIYLDQEQFLPAPAQGVLGIQIREDDSEAANAVAPLDSAQAAREVALERGLLARFNAGCSLPLGVYSEVAADHMRLVAVLGERDGDGWGGLKRVDISGADSSAMVAEAYRRLTEK